MIKIGTIDGKSNVTETYADDVLLDGKIDGKSTANLSATGYFHVGDKIDGQSTANIKAGRDISIGSKIDGKSTVQLDAGTGVTLNWVIDGASHVQIMARGGSIEIRDKIDGGSQVFLYATDAIHIVGKVDNPHTHITWWAPSIDIDGGVNGGATVERSNWGNFPDLPTKSTRQGPEKKRAQAHPLAQP
jgi:hypothetical protein